MSQVFQNRNTQTQCLLNKSNQLSKIPSLPKTKKKMSGLVHAKAEPILKQRTESLQQNGNQDYSTGSDLERCSIYVDRFRHGQPQSREERQQCSNSEKEQLPFWWASSPSLPIHLTPEKTVQKLPHHNTAISPCQGSLSVFSDILQCEPYESEILLLQERASTLLQKDEFSLDEDSLPVSSDGVGCSDFSSPISADESARKPMISSFPKYNIVMPLRPEEDILFQWRLRRKMEKARDATLSPQHLDTYDWQGLNKGQPLNSDHQIMDQHTTPPDLQQGTTHRLINRPHFATLDQQTSVTNATTIPTTKVFPGSVVPSPQSFAHVPSHMHLLCDILPCPNRTSYHHEEKTFFQKSDSSLNLPSESPLTGCVEKDDHLIHVKSTEASKKQPVKNIEKKLLKKSTSTQRLGQKHKDSNKKSREDKTPPTFPLKSALGQVVSEVLFPTDVQDNPPAVPPSLVTDPQQNNNYESAELISHFLNEAEGIQMKRSLKTILCFKCFENRGNGLKNKSMKWTYC
ncbi:hypothetical protein WMY93_026303 [Mugilogobius chulae]|uniref:Uncharacterized protein n=1 Tax=Mugilogobius chulae TaxID=88201 RepID=A0AAW0MX26_9GOBI